MKRPFWFRAYYNEDAAALWRHKNPGITSIGPRAGEVAIEVHYTTAEARDVEAELARARPDVGAIECGESA